MRIDEGSWVAPWGKWQDELCRRAGEVDTWEASLRHLGQLPEAPSGLRLASYLDSLYFLLGQQAWHVAQGRNGDSRAERAGEPCH